MDIDIEHLRTWIGRTENAADVATAAPLACLAATLDRDEPEPRPGDPVPPGGHWLYFLPRTRTSDLDENGHARTGGFLPPVPLARRMWAGGRIRFRAPLRVGDAIERRSEIADVTSKEGRTGALVFVLVRHTVSGPDGAAIEEEHDIVYRGTPAPEVYRGTPAPEVYRGTPAPEVHRDAPPKGSDAGAGAATPSAAAPATPAWTRTVTPDIVMLFRYSALIFNGHRIHYDRDYVTRVEGYPGLIVHGPLIATLLMDLCRRERPDAPMTRFDYRARRALFDSGPFTVNGRPDTRSAAAALWAADADGNVAMTAEAGFADG